MARCAVPYDYRLQDTLALLKKPGLVLASTKPSGESNVMTIGWGSVGIIWGKPMFVALVRPSRYTYEFIEASGEFTVNVPNADMTRWVGICGTRSGRDGDKLAMYGVSASTGRTVASVTVDACPMVYECRVVHHNDLIPSNLDADIKRRAYGGSDYHRVYFGEITGAFALSNY